MAKLFAQKVQVPPHVEQNSTALHLEMYRIGNCAVLIAREDVADTRAESRDYRWHLTIAHDERLPTWDEVKIARDLLPDDVHMALPFPHAAYWLDADSLGFHIWEVGDANLTEHWEYAAIQRRKAAEGES